MLVLNHNKLISNFNRDNPMLNINNVIWKDIKGYEGRYQVSSTGKVRSIQDNHGNACSRIRKTTIRSENYEYVELWIKDKGKVYGVHRLVAGAFHKNPEDKPLVNHKDGNKLNNNAYNLEWVTQSENHLHAYATGLRVPSRNWLGKKWGGSSSYNNVTYDKTKDRWIASIKLDGKLYAKRFPVKKHGDQAEVLAALAVNDLLDELGLTDRARNIIN